MYGYIYKTTNLVNGKIYIGQKKSDIFLENDYLGSGKRLKSAIMHYGKANFKVELLEACDSKHELDEKEIYYIEYYDSQNKDIGYNLTKGGDGVAGITAWNKGLTKEQDDRLIKSEETKLKHSNSLKRAYAEGRRSNNWTPEARKKISESNKRRDLSNFTTKGRSWYTNGVDNKFCKPEEIDYYISLGYYKGRKTGCTPWNKGLSKETDERLMNVSNYRKEYLKENQIGFCGCPGNHFSKGQKVKEYNHNK